MVKPNFSLGNVRDELLRDGDDWTEFSRFWQNLPRDPHMGDGGTYRRRKYSPLTHDSVEGTVRMSIEDSFLQSKEINKLNGGVVRRFEPIDPNLPETAVFQRMLAHFTARIQESAPGDEPAVPVRRINIHQHRVVATAAEAGKPTPEGIHRDGVDHIVMMLVAREGIDGGVSTLYDNSEQPILSHTLTNPGDYIFLDDHTCLHSVSPVQVAAPHSEGHRDMFFMEFCAGAPGEVDVTMREQVAQR